MYFIDVISLKRDLTAGGLRDSQQAAYLLALLAGSSIPSANAIGGWPPWSNFDWLTWFLGTLVLLGGTFFCYTRNGGRNGVQFLERYLSLQWVVGIRWLPLLVAWLVLVIMLARIVGLDAESRPLVFRLSLPFFGALIYSRVGHHIAQVARSSA